VTGWSEPVGPQPQGENQPIFDAANAYGAKTSVDSRHWSRTGPKTGHEGGLSEVSNSCDLESAVMGETDNVPSEDVATTEEE
jgi:hypothetical protein